MERLISILGPGFVGGRYHELTSNSVTNDKYDYEPKSDEIVYFISTIDNYNVHTNPYLDIDTNLTVLIKTLEHCKGKTVTFNFISSWFVYGDVELPAKESSYCDPKGFYSITKRAAEQLLISYCETFDIEYRIIRLANVLGKSDSKVSKKKNALQYMIEEIKNGRDVDMYDGGKIFRDYIHVDDVVQAINLIIDNGELNTIYNVGNGKEIYLKDALSYVKNKTNSTSMLNSIESAKFHQKVQTKNMVLDISKIRSLGYKPKFDIYQALDTLI
jgi:nucleoside-diphosphate-sugar epimerase